MSSVAPSDAGLPQHCCRHTGFTPRGVGDSLASRVALGMLDKPGLEGRHVGGIRYTLQRLGASMRACTKSTRFNGSVLGLDPSFESLDALRQALRCDRTAWTAAARVPRGRP